MDEKPDVSNKDIATSSGKQSRVKRLCLYCAVSALYITVLSPSILPTYFYFTSEKPEGIQNDTSEWNTTSSSGSAGYNYRNTSYCNKPLIPKKFNNLTLCVPQCGWSPLTTDETNQINATVHTSCIISIISFFLVLITSCKVAELRKFPHVIIVIMLAETAIIVSVVSVGTFIGTDIFCSSKFLPVATKNATAFCVFQGVLLQYLEGSVALWFVAYNAVIAKGLVFPRLQPHRSSKGSFLVSGAVCWILPVIPVIIVLTSNDGYRLFFNFCFPGSLKLIYYTAILPETVLYAIGVSFLHIIVWKLLKEMRTPIPASQEQAKTRISKMENVVKRFTLLMIFYCATVYLTFGCLSYLLSKAKVLKTSSERYFYCLEFQPNCPKDYQKHTSHILLILNYVSAGIFPLATVLFMAANERTRRFWKAPFYKLRCYIFPYSSRSTDSSLLVNEEKISGKKLEDRFS